MEAAGLALATISILATALEKPVDTLESICLLRTARYRRQLEQYCNRLAGQQASLVNAIEIALGVKIKEEDISSISSHPYTSTSIWRDPALQTKLQERLGRDRAVFTSLIANAKHIIQDLSHVGYYESLSSQIEKREVT